MLPAARNHTKMAKGSSIFSGVMRKKLGNQVLYRISNSNNGEKQGARAYVAQIANPRSYAQARQRAKLVPANAFFEAFEPVLNHAFLPKGNTARNRFRFFGGAMRLDYVPDVPKGQSRIPFAPYQVSEGSLSLDNLVKGTAAQTTDSRHSVRFGLKDATAAAANAFGAKTIAAVTAELLAANPMLREGYELCFLAVVADPSDMGSRRAAYASFVLSSSNTLTTIADVLPDPLRLIANGGYIHLGSNESAGIVLSAGLIISARSKSSWRYTTSYMAETTQAIDGIDWDPEDVILSYMSAAGSEATSDKILQQADNSAGGTSDVVAIRLVKVAAPTITEVSDLNSDQVVAVEMSNGERRLLVAWGNNDWSVSMGESMTADANVPLFITSWNPGGWLTGLQCVDTESTLYGKNAAVRISSYAGQATYPYSSQWQAALEALG